MGSSLVRHWRPTPTTGTAWTAATPERGEGSLSTTSTLRIEQDVLSGQPGFYADLTATIDYA
jgi:hypothetical protein